MQKENLEANKKLKSDPSSKQNFYQLQNPPEYNSSRLFACPSGMGMSQYIGSSSLRHASLYTTFSKAERFPQHKLTEAQALSNVNLPPTTTKLTTTFGFGSKVLYPQHTLRNAKEYPSPDHYYKTKTLPDKHQGKSFGIPYKFYSKTYIPKNPLQSIEIARELPGVGQYEVVQEPGKNKLKYSLYGKIPERTQQENMPASNHYNPLYKLEENLRFTQITFGKGNKYDFTKSNKNGNPGPGSYTLPSPFDKFDPLRRSTGKISRRTAFV